MKFNNVNIAAVCKLLVSRFSFLVSRFSFLVSRFGDEWSATIFDTTTWDAYLEMVKNKI